MSGASLLGLPLELRIRIWSLALGGAVLEVHCWPSQDPDQMETRIANRRTHHCGLLRICHQIYNEAKLCLFRDNGFLFKNEDAVIPWLRRFREHERNAISEIRLVTWGAKHMIQGHRSCLKPVLAVLPLEVLPGLVQLQIEIRREAKCRTCWHNCCSCFDEDIEPTKAQLELLAAQRQPRVRLEFVEQKFVSFQGAQVL